MNINQIKAHKICEAVLNTKSSDRRLWDISWSKDFSRDILSQNNGRCYIIVVNDEIYKLGYSDQIGGIKATIETYKGAGNSGRPSDRTHGIHILITQELLKGNKVEFYFHYNEDITVKIPLMDGSITEVKTSISGKILETENMKLFLKKEGKYPIWNFQEAGRAWPKYLQDSRMKLCSEGIPVILEDLKNLKY